MSNTTTLPDPRQAPSMCALFQDAVADRGAQVALRSSDGVLTLSWRQYGDRVRRIAAGLSALGVRRGDTVGLMLTNRPEFFLVDMAVMHLGATPFSIYNTSSPEQMDYLFSTAENQVVVFESQFSDRVRAVAQNRGIERLVCVDGAGEDIMSLEDLEDAGNEDFDFEAAWRAVGHDDVITLIFTSGTTGAPKAVELTHGNLLYTCFCLFTFPDALGAAVPGATVLSYLPDAHLADRLFAYYLPTTTAATVVTVREARTVGAVLAQARPTLFSGVPLIWYRIKTGIEQAVANATGERKELMTQALATGRELVQHKASGDQVPAELQARYDDADRTVLAHLRGLFGLDNLAAGISGGAPITADALMFFSSLGIPVVEGWAMSETSGAGLLNPPNRIKPGKVGPPVPESEIKLAEDGELLVRSAGVMKGYRNAPEKTAEAIDADGWLHTGDIATIDEDGYVAIVDRKKELIINTAGKNMSPAHIENAVKTAGSLVGSVVAVGDKRPYVTAMITLDPDAVTAFATARGIVDLSSQALALHEEILSAVQAGIDLANASLSRVESVRRFTVLPTYWLPDSDELTPTMKLKRKVIHAKYDAEIDEMYARPDTRGQSSQPVQGA